MKTKICSTCKIEKPISEFHKRIDGILGCFARCKECNHNHYVVWYIDKGKEYHNNYYKINKKIKAKYNKKYQKENKIQIKEQKRKYRKQNKEKIKLSNKNWRNIHKEEIKQKTKIYQQKNRNKINKQRANQKRNRRMVDINFKLSTNLRTYLRNSLKQNSKSDNTFKLLSCDIEFLKQHLESQFKKGMSWYNYGRGWNGKKEWHIDHIYPCASFDLSNTEEQQICFHWSNLQPLWAFDNLSKGNKI